jgi:hypothetical protein
MGAIFTVQPTIGQEHNLIFQWMLCLMIMKAYYNFIWEKLWHIFTEEWVPVLSLIIMK